ncbi:MAG: thioesterase family protein [Rudaea sp.]
MTLTELMQRATPLPGSFTATVTDDWLQGRSAFGGLQGAFALAAMRTLVPAEFPLRTLQMTFIAPVESGECITHASILRAGKNTRHVEARIEHGGELLAHAIAVFGMSRESTVLRDAPAPTAMTNAGTRIPFVPNITPSFFQHFDVTFLEGGLPFSNSRAHRNVFRLGMKEPGDTTEAHLMALTDFVPPVALSWMPKPAPGSSLTWMLEILNHDFASQPLQGWRVEADLVAARDGYTSQSTTLWAPNGVATVLSRQSMVVFG